MLLHRFVIGILFNRKMFRLPSVGGMAIDEILKTCEQDKKLGYGFFNQVSTPATKEGEYSVSMINNGRHNSLSILPDQVVFKRSSTNDSSATSPDKVMEEFSILWKAANKIIEFPEIRRIGLVGEYRIKERKQGSAGIQLIEALTKFKAPDSCGRFHLNFESRSLNSKGEIASTETDDFWNELFSFYISDIDETPEKGKLNANIDVQRYYNPAKRELGRELSLVKDKYLDRKKHFKESLKEMGLSD